MAIKAIIFDVGGVLVDYNMPADMRYWQEQIGLTDEQAKEFVSDLVSLMGKGKLDEAAFWQHINQKHGHPLPPAGKSALKSSFLRHTQPRQEVIEFARNLVKQGYKIALLSDTITPHAESLAELDVYTPFKHRFLSHELGLAKPDPAFFRHALKVLAIEPEEAVFVDDLPGNIEAAEALGMHGIKAVSAEQVIQDVGSYLRR